MRRFFQSFGFRESPYHRPFQKWVCGRAAGGRPCLLGPGDRGECRIRFECRPVRDGDRWVCTRPESAGGKCAPGPMSDGACGLTPIPCTPVRSFRARRGLTARWMAAVTVGLLLILFGGSQGYQAVSHGGLTAPHAEFGNQCASCHTAIQHSPLEWVGMAIGTSVSDADSQLCLSCHQMGHESVFPHHRARVELAALRADVRPPSTSGSTPVLLKLADRVFQPMTMADDSLPCSTCHREHQGARADLTAMDNVRCQACHTGKFDSLAHGHPEFDSFPYDRRTRLVFDHGSHISRHFLDPRVAGSAPAECNSCHTPDVLGDGMWVRGFEATCAACHATQVVDRGVPFIAVPGLDVYGLEDLGVEIGYWPEYADAEPTPFMELLLSADADYVAARETLRDVDLLDLADATEEEAEAAATIAWSVKTLFAELITEGGPGIHDRLEAAVGRPVTDVEMAALIGTLPVDAVRAIQTRWFPALLQEVEAHAAGEPLPDVEEPAEPEFPGVPDEEWAGTGGWYIDYFSLIYRPLGHSDPMLKGWLNFAAAAAEPTQDTAANRLLDELAQPGAPGSCGKCHSVDKTAHGGFLVNWREKQLDPQEHRFTDFSHVSHFNLSGIQGCTDCHVLDLQAPYLAAFEDRDPAAFHANFKPVERQVCATCHLPQQAGDSCTTCHNYHVGTFPPAVIGGPLMVETSAGGEGENPAEGEAEPPKP